MPIATKGVEYIPCIGGIQALFARYLNVTPGLVSQWERGEKRLQGESLKLLSLVARSGLAAVA
ncbi:MAG: hypothetical protein K2X74_11345 [Acetobacteraceae bacterium]|nr:hypothetical protein [Acetobacteraceae bacterium]